MIAPGVLISCALFALLPGVLKFDFLLTVLPLTPFNAVGRGVFGTSPSNLSSLSLQVYEVLIVTAYISYMSPPFALGVG
jgi:hypothetical protein